MVRTSKPDNINRALGIAPTVANFTNPPANLANATDNNWAVGTTVGTTVLGAAGEIRRWLIDLGAVYNVEIRALILRGNNIVGGGTDETILDGSEDNITFYQFDSGYSFFLWIANNTEWQFIHGFLRARYIRLIHNGDAAGTWSAAIHEIQALDHGV